MTAKASTSNFQQNRQVVAYYPRQEMAAPDEGIDARNGWQEPDRGNPLAAELSHGNGKYLGSRVSRPTDRQSGPGSRGARPSERRTGTAFDDERISLCSDELGRLFQWLLFGGSERDRGRRGPVNEKLKAAFHACRFEAVLKRPAAIGIRVIAMLLRIRPDLLEGRSAKTLAKRLRLSRRMLAHYTISFGENFPAGAKVIRRKCRLVNEEVLRRRHSGKGRGN